MNNVVAAVITYNRFELLKEVIAALKSQTYQLQEIVVVNNSSTDGTREWLSLQEGLTIIDQPNNGISDGVYTAVKHGAKVNAAWTWVMDDDSVPTETALEKMMEKLPLVEEKVGFLSPKCVWTDGSIHSMNIPDIKNYVNGVAFNKYDQQGILLTDSGSFASMVIGTQAAKVVGLPYKDFFIWGDDQEYSKRIADAGYPGIYCGDSLVVHKTPTNYNVDVYSASVNHIWKHRYGFRNEFFMVRKRKGWLYYLPWLTAKVGYSSAKIMLKRKDHKLKFVSALINSAWKSLSFSPKIDKI
jgi:rhamnopyranosyl-N-acetylglucosaminyl-diphospho-decaprenol beta-1,3/1,4-galactofuranosyltransferase